MLRLFMFISRQGADSDGLCRCRDRSNNRHKRHTLDKKNIINRQKQPPDLTVFEGLYAVLDASFCRSLAFSTWQAFAFKIGRLPAISKANESITNNFKGVSSHVAFHALYEINICTHSRKYWSWGKKAGTFRCINFLSIHLLRIGPTCRPSSDLVSFSNCDSLYNIHTSI